MEPGATVKRVTLRPTARVPRRPRSAAEVMIVHLTRNIKNTLAAIFEVKALRNLMFYVNTTVLYQYLIKLIDFAPFFDGPVVDDPTRHRFYGSAETKRERRKWLLQRGEDRLCVTPHTT